MEAVGAINAQNVPRSEETLPPVQALQGADQEVIPKRQADPAQEKPENANAPVDVSREKIENISQALENYVQSTQRDLHLKVHGDTGKIMVQVFAKSDGKLIREIPPEELLNLAAKMEEMVGVLFSKTA
jgi:flagellar protein FlaG